MTTIYLIGGGVIFLAFSFWAYRKLGEQFGREKLKSDIARVEAKKVENASNAIINGPRSRDDIRNRLRGDDPV